jgi:hypothetical protein
VVRSRWAWLALFASCAPACSLTDIVQVEVPRCDGQSDCDALNAFHEIDPATACELYQCRNAAMARGECRLGPRDLDEDGHAPAWCTGGDDCDDADPTSPEGGEELTPVLTGVDDTPSWLHWSTTISGSGTSACGLVPRSGVTYELGAVSHFDLVPTVPCGSAPVSADPVSVGFAQDAVADVTSPAIAAGCRVYSGGAVLTRPAAMNTVPGETCVSNDDCDDGVFCNGLEYCDPAVATGFGCVDGFLLRCGLLTGDLCDEAREICVGTAVSEESCPVLELASSSLGGDAWLAAAIRTGECPYGQLRIGWQSTDGTDLTLGRPGRDVLVRGDERRAPAFWGIDILGSGELRECSGGGRAGAPVLGVSSPSASTLEADPDARRRRPQGIVAWLAAPNCRQTGCASGIDFNADAVVDYTDTDPVGVELIGAWYEQSATTESPFWTTPTGDGGPVRLPTRTRGRSAPALVAVDAPRAGYLVAYGAESGGFVLRFVPAFEDPSEVTRTVEPYITPILGTSPKRTTPALASIGTEHHVERDAAALVDGVTIAPGAPDGDLLPILVAWLEDGELVAMRVALDLASDTLTTGTARTIASSGAVAQPSIAFGCGPECDGWSLAFTVDGEVRLAVIDEDGVRMGDVVEVGGTSASFPRPIPSETTVRVLFHDAGESAFVVSRGFCAPE